MVITERTENTFFALDFGHWLKVRKAREAAGLPVGRCGAAVEQAHPTLGRQFVQRAERVKAAVDRT